MECRPKLPVLGYGRNKVIDIETPKDLYEDLNREFGPFGFDPCPLGGKEYMDGLKLDWPENCFVNPPFNEIAKWVRKAVQELTKGKRVVMLIPARVKSKYWFDYIWPVAK